MTTLIHPSKTTADQDKKIVVTLTSEPASFTRRLADRMNVSVPEVVRRALTVLNLVVSLADDEELVIRNKTTREAERVRFQWGLVSERS